MPLSGRKLFELLKRGLTSVRSLNDTQRIIIRNELGEARGLINLLMKHRNGQSWSKEERKVLLQELRNLSHLSPYLIPLLMPGGIFMLPLVAYWIDRRRNQRNNDHRNNGTDKQNPEEQTTSTS